MELKELIGIAFAILVLRSIYRSTPNLGARDDYKKALESRSLDPTAQFNHFQSQRVVAVLVIIVIILTFYIICCTKT